MAETTTDQLIASAIHLEEIKFLVVDDSFFVRSVIRQVLKALGVREIFEASDGGEGYEVARQVNPDIALVDWLMEPEDGLEFVKKIRHGKDSPSRLMPIIMVSGYSEESRVLAARDAGVNEFVVKPLSPASLFSRIQWVIENPRRFVTTDTYFGPDRRRKYVPFKGKDRRAGGPEAEAPADNGEQVYLDVEPEPAKDDATAAAETGDGGDGGDGGDSDGKAPS